MSCTDYTRWLSSYDDEQLGPAERQELEGHLQGCAACREELAALQRMLQMLSALEQPEAPDLRAGIHARLAQRPWWARLVQAIVSPIPGHLPWHQIALAASLLLVVVTVGLPRALRWHDVQELGQPVQREEARALNEAAPSDATMRQAKSAAKQAAVAEPGTPAASARYGLVAGQIQPAASTLEVRDRRVEGMSDALSKDDQPKSVLFRASASAEMNAALPPMPLGRVDVGASTSGITVPEPPPEGSEMYTVDLHHPSEQRADEAQRLERYEAPARALDKTENLEAERDAAVMGGRKKEAAAVGLTHRIWTDRTQYAVGEPILVHHELTNAGSQPIELIDLTKAQRWLLPAQLITYVIQDPAGGRVSYTGGIVDYMPGTAGDRSVLASGAAMQGTVTLNAPEGGTYRLTQPGRYRITATYQGFVGAVPEYPAGVESNSLEIELTP